jgi:hypothetical protein
MVYARKPKFCWLSAGPYILAWSLFFGLIGSRLPGWLGTGFAWLALVPLLMIVFAAAFAVLGMVFRGLR